MEVLPIEMIEHILRFCSGSQFSLSARVSTKWWKAIQNIERTDDSFWMNKCFKEIDMNLIEDLNVYHKSLDQLESYQCKEVYIKWFRTQTIPKLTFESFKSSETFRSSYGGFRDITALTVTGTLVITGHRTGKVYLIDVMNDKNPLEITEHLHPVNDLVPINIVGKESYEIHNQEKRMNGCETEQPSFSNHHHVITITDSRIHICLISERNVGEEFSIHPRVRRYYLKGKVCRDMLAVSSKGNVDISLFRLVLPKEGVVPISESVKAEVIRIISCEQVFDRPHHWLGIFTFNDLKLNCFSHESNRIVCSNLALNLLTENNDNPFKYKWSAINEINYECCTKEYDYHENVNLKIRNCYSFGQNIFFIITQNNETIFTTDSQTFRLSELNHCMARGDQILTLCLYGSALAYGTNEGYVIVHHIPKLERLKYLTHYKPVFKERICKEAIIKISVTDTGKGLILVATTKQNVYLLKWSSDLNNGNKDDNKQIEVITIG